MAQIQLEQTAQVNIFSQYALLQAVRAKNSQEKKYIQWQKNNLITYKNNKDFLMTSLEQLSVQIKVIFEPQAGFFLLIDCSLCKNLFFTHPGGFYSGLFCRMVRTRYHL